MGGIAESVADGSEVVVQKLALSSSATENSIKVCAPHSASHRLLVLYRSSLFLLLPDKASAFNEEPVPLLVLRVVGLISNTLYCNRRAASTCVAFKLISSQLISRVFHLLFCVSPSSASPLLLFFHFLSHSPYVLLCFAFLPTAIKQLPYTTQDTTPPVIHLGFWVVSYVENDNPHTLATLVFPRTYGMHTRFFCSAFFVCVLCSILLSCLGVCRVALASYLFRSASQPRRALSPRRAVHQTFSRRVRPG